MLTYINYVKTWLNVNALPEISYHIKSLFNLNYANNFKTHQSMYLFLNKNFNVSFAVFAELTYVLNSFNVRNYDYALTIFAYFFRLARIQNNNFTVKHLLRNKPIMYFFNSKSFFKIPVILYKLKKLTHQVSIKLHSSFLIRFSPTNVSKYLNSYYLNSLDILYLRKNKVFNKGRYSRNRQFYRTGVYWCLYINIIAVIGLYFWFYRFVMNFGYLWWLLFLSLASFLVAKSLNYNLLNPVNLYKSIISDLVFFLEILINLFSNTVSLLNQLTFNFFGETSQSYPELFERFFKTDWWLMSTVIKTYIYPIKFTYFWEYHNINYYIHSITLNYNRVFLDTKKHKYFTSFATMLFKK